MPMSVAGLTFDETELRAMTRIVDEVCTEISKQESPEEREFVAWLVVRLAHRGINDVEKLKSAALHALQFRAQFSYDAKQ